MTTPIWAAPQNGTTADLDAVQSASHVNQLLAAHAMEAVYNGLPEVAPIHGGQNFQWYQPAQNTDVSQPFVLSGTSIGRVVLPLLPSNNGADCLVTLYPDSSGSPNLSAPVASTMVPAAYQTQVAANFGLGAAGAPVLATGQNNGMFLTGNFSPVTWALPAATINGISSTSTFLFDSNYVISAGGQDSITGLNVPNVFSFNCPGGNSLALPTPQPSLPVGLEGNGLVICNGSVVSVGGFTTANSALVFTASWAPTTGVIGSWSQQTALPQATEFMGVASSGSFVYCVGGRATASQVVTANVYVNTVTNGQTGSWTQLNSLPQALSNLACFAVNGWLVAVGGDNAGFTAVTNVYYAQIKPDGSIGPWQNGPSLPFAFDANQGGQAVLAGSTIVLLGGITTSCQTLAFTSEGPAPAWRVSDYNASVGYVYQGAFSNGDGTYSVIVFRINGLSVTVQSSTLTSAPMISVPLFATGLTNGNTYHIVVQSVQSKSASDFTSIGLINAGSGGNAYTVSALSSSRYSGSWSTITTGSCVPMQLFDASVGGNPIHLWEEPEPQFKVVQSTSGLLYNATGFLNGLLTVTSHPNPPLNVNPTFTSGVTPWIATNGAVSQSNAQTHGGFPFSGLLTPTGGFSQSYALSEQFPITQTPWGSAQWVYPTGFFYTPTTWTTFTLSMNWFDNAGNYISTSSSTATLTGATWTSVTNYFQVPATAATGQIVPTLNGTPTAAQLLYMSNVRLLMTPETVPALTGVEQIVYNGTGYQPSIINQLV